MQEETEHRKTSKGIGIKESVQFPFSSFPSYSGTEIENVELWLDQINNFAMTLGWNEPEYLTYMQLLLKGSAQQWLMTLDPDSRSTVAKLIKALKESFMINKTRFAKEQA